MYGYNGTDSWIKNVEAVAKYGTVEGYKSFDDIFPTWKGIASIIGVTDIFSFFDNDITFDINDYLMSGMEAKICFNSGKLAGYEFPIRRFESNTGKFILETITDTQDLQIPNANSAFQISEGDTYTILDITLPQENIDVAERALFNAAKEWLDAHSVPTVLYDAEIDRMYLKNHPISREIWFDVGDSISLQDDDVIDGTEDVRIVGFKRDLLIAEKYTFTFGNNAFRNTISAIARKANDNAAIINNSVYQNPVRSKSANIRIRSNDYDGGRLNG